MVEVWRGKAGQGKARPGAARLGKARHGEIIMTQYERGVRYERRARKELEADGWMVVRSAGRRGACDLIALKVRQIQVKAVNRPQGWAAELEEMEAGLPHGPGMTRELWVWNKGCGWEKYTVEDEG